MTLFVDDQERSRRFYADVLGMEIRTDRQMGDNRWLEVAPVGAESAFVLHKPFPGMGAAPIRGVLLGCADLDAACGTLAAAGVDVDGPTEMPWGRQATFADPDGNSFVLAAPSGG